MVLFKRQGPDGKNPNCGVCERGAHFPGQLTPIPLSIAEQPAFGSSRGDLRGDFRQDLGCDEAVENTDLLSLSHTNPCLLPTTSSVFCGYYYYYCCVSQVSADESTQYNVYAACCLRQPRAVAPSSSPPRSTLFFSSLRMGRVAVYFIQIQTQLSRRIPNSKFKFQISKICLLFFTPRTLGMVRSTCQRVDEYTFSPCNELLHGQKQMWSAVCLVRRVYETQPTWPIHNCGDFSMGSILSFKMKSPHLIHSLMSNHRLCSGMGLYGALASQRVDECVFSS